MWGRAALVWYILDIFLVYSWCILDIFLIYSWYILDVFFLYFYIRFFFAPVTSLWRGDALDATADTYWGTAQLKDATVDPVRPRKSNKIAMGKNINYVYSFFFLPWVGSWPHVCFRFSILDLHMRFLGTLYFDSFLISFCWVPKNLTGEILNYGPK